ncbi:hypothetical protein Mapa_015829 [Marchantia paleacea]|nr:hypothetical protein Mapa_015829 [Marchantia paleacea]
MDILLAELPNGVFKKGSSTWWNSVRTRKLCRPQLSTSRPLCAPSLESFLVEWNFNCTEDPCTPQNSAP